MDFGVIGLDGLFASNKATTTITSTTTSPTSASGFSSFASLDLVPKQKNPRSGFLKQERSGSIENNFRRSKLPKTESLLFQHESTLYPSCKIISFIKDGDNDGRKQPQMLSFSRPKSEAHSVDRSYQNASLFPSFQLTPTAYDSRSTGHGYTISNVGSMQLGVLTQSQLMELEHQALIYKYITSNVPIPSNLLIPIKKAVESARLSCFPGSLLRTNSLGWENFHLGYSGNTDPEPGRCRRTDGKKWRCSRDAVPDQKYCERHINRGRHRSRKPVEGQSGQSAATSTITGKGTLATSPNAAASLAVGSQGSGDLNSLSFLQQRQLKNLQLACPPNLSATTSLSRAVLDKENRESGTLFFNPSTNHTSSTSDGGYISTKGMTKQEGFASHSLHQFMDDWANKSQSDQSSVSWSQLDMKLDRPQLSISIPTRGPADYMLSTSSPSNERLTTSAFTFSPGSDQTHMGLTVGKLLNEPNPRRSSWISVPCETSLGGPLGEVLKNTSKNSSGESKNPSSLNLMTKGRGMNPPIDSSPTGILQKATCNSILTGSVGSLRADNKTSESASVCNDIGSTRVKPSVPALFITTTKTQGFATLSN